MQRYTAIALGLVVVAAAFVTLPAAPASGAFTIVNVSHSSNYSYRPSIGISGSTVIVLWLECPPTCRLSLSRSLDGGATWSDAVVLSSGSSVVIDYEWRIVGRYLFVTWVAADEEIYFRRSADGGMTWASTINLSQSPGVESRRPRLAASGGRNVYVVWQEFASSGKPEVYFRRSTNAGTSFGGATNLSNSFSRFSYSPAIDASGPNVYVAWPESAAEGTRETILFRRSVDGGANWFAPIAVTPSGQRPFFWPPFQPLIAAGESVYIAYDFALDENLADAQVGIVRSTDGGASFTSPQVIFAGPKSHDAHLLVSGTFVYFLWGEFVSSGPVNTEVMLRRSLDGGATWLNAQNISTNDGNSYSETVSWVLNGTSLHVVWRDLIGNDEILYRRSADAGASFGPKVNISNNPVPSYSPGIVVVGRNGYIVWSDAATMGANPDVFVARTTAGGFNALPLAGATDLGAGEVSSPNPTPNYWCSPEIISMRPAAYRVPCAEPALPARRGR